MVRCAKYKITAVFEKPVRAADSYGEGIPTWTEYCTRKVWIIPKYTKEVLAGQEIHSEARNKVLLRYDKHTRAITTDMRMVVTRLDSTDTDVTDYHDIFSVQDVRSEHREIEMWTSRGMRDG